MGLEMSTHDRLQAFAAIILILFGLMVPRLWIAALGGAIIGACKVVLELLMMPEFQRARLLASPDPVPVGNLRSEILVVQSAQNWDRQRATASLDSTWDRCVLVQR
jgi:hypothetical protein